MKEVKGQDIKKRTTRSDVVAEKLLEAIASGEFEAGSRLPSESVLAEHFQVSRGTLRNAFKKLEQMGKIQARRGSGTYVLHGGAQPGDREGDAAAKTLVNQVFTVDDFQVSQYVEARGVIELAAIDLAVERIDDADLWRLREILDATMSSPDAEYSKWDREFHRALVASAKNDFLDRFWAIIEPCMGTQHERLYGAEGWYAASKQKHLDIYEALLRHDKEQAKRLMREHHSLILGRFFMRAVELQKGINDAKTH